MSAPSTATPAPSQSGVFFGWKVVAVAFLIAVFAWGLGFYGPSVFVNELVRSRSWPVSVVSGAMTFHFLFSACLILFLGDAHARLGVIAVTRVGVVSFGLGVIGFAHAMEPWQLYPAAALTGIGWSACSGAAINTFVAPWFAERRALALSHAYNGASIGGVVFSPLWAFLIARYGFPAATIAVAVGGVLILWPLAGRYLGQVPADRDQRPDGAVVAPDTAVASAADDPPLSRQALLRDPRFLTLSVGFAIGIFAQMGLLTHLLVRLTPVLGDQGAALALSLATACAIIGRFVLAGVIGIDQRRLAGALNFCLQAVGVWLLIVGEAAPALLSGCVLFGLGIGNLLSLPPLILQTEHRSVDVARALALLTAVNQFVYAFAPAAFGLLRDLTGDYTVPFMLAAATQVISAAIILSDRQD